MSTENTQVVYTTTTTKRAAPAYPFLSRPPPPKKRPAQPLPAIPNQSHISPCTSPAHGRRRSATTSNITAWVSSVHPGSPAPYSPRRSPSAYSLSRRFSGSRRPSITSVRVASASFLNLAETPSTASRLIITPSMKDFKHDLTTVGYTSVFVTVPNTPLSPDLDKKRMPSPIFLAPTSIDKAKGAQRGLKRFKSLTFLKSSRRERLQIPPSSPVPRLRVDARTARAVSSAAVSKNKKSKYAKFRPPPLANELALAQLMDGGKVEDHVKRFAEAQAKAAGAVKVDGQLVGVGDVWRDGEGGIWRDQDEEWEYAHLLGGEEDFCMSEVDWVQFGKEGKEEVLVVDERRESLSTQDSDLNGQYAMQAEVEAHDDLAAFGGALVPATLIKPGMSVLAIPARSRRTAKHLRKPEFLLDIFPVPLSPTGLPRTPRSPRYTFAATMVASRSQGKARRRPAPLKLMPPSPAFKCPTNPLDPDAIRQDFLEDSFAPKLSVATRAPVTLPSPNPIPRRVPAAKEITLKPSLLNVRGLFRAMGGRKVHAS